MNLEQTNDLLTFAAAIDNRRVDDATVLAWQAVLSDLDGTDAMEAVRHHLGHSRDYLTPAVVRELVEAEQAERIRRHEIERAVKIRDERDSRAIEAPQSTPEEVAALLADVRSRLKPSRPGVLGERVRVELGKPRSAPSAFGGIGLRLVADLAPDMPEAEASGPLRRPPTGITRSRPPSTPKEQRRNERGPA